MNILFWALLLLMLLVAVVIVIYPLLRVRRSSAIAYKDSNLGLYDDKLAELEADLGEGRIEHEQYQQARQEIDRELLQDIPTESTETASIHYGGQLKRQPGLAVMISVFLPTLALLVYMKLGMHAASTDSHQAQMQAQAQAQAQQTQQAGTVEDMTNALAARIKQQGGNLQEWTMLARAYKHLGQYLQSAEAYEQAVKQGPSAQLMIEQSEVIALANNQRFTPAARELVMRALEMEPNNVNVLWFAGVAEYQAGNYRKSIEHLSRLSEQAKQDAEINRSLRIYIDKARDGLIAAGEEVATTDEILGTAATTTAAAAGGASLQVSVDINKDVRNRFSAGDAVFIYAKAAAGPKMPLAVQRLTLDQLPTTVTLDDSMAMMEGMNMSSFGSVVVSARVTTSGSAIAKAGDYIGEFKVDDVSGTEQVKIQIDTLVQ
ncbi:MAG: c-type cytochrome biogenesis protein CcmI [Thiotrichales bacterium]|nr:MAG: c-type cytochrome biogenesis protein CcmI [Thiotrichales bacterium]